MSEKKIGEMTFRVEPILATESLVLKARLMQLLGGGISRLPAIVRGYGDEASAEEKSESDKAAVAAFTDVFVNSEPEKMAQLVKDVVEIAQIQLASEGYTKVDIDREFTGKDKEMMECAVFVLSELFGDFLGGGPGNGSLKIPAMGKASQTKN